MVKVEVDESFLACSMGLEERRIVVRMRVPVPPPRVQDDAAMLDLVTSRVLGQVMTYLRTEVDGLRFLA
jgi:hypothetical protein